MSKFSSLLAHVSLLGSPAMAQTAKRRSDDSACQRCATFGPAAIARCISIGSEVRTDFSHQVGDKQRAFIAAGTQHGGVLGSGPVPDECDLHWINVTEPQ